MLYTFLVVMNLNVFVAAITTLNDTKFRQQELLTKESHHYFVYSMRHSKNKPSLKHFNPRTIDEKSVENKFCSNPVYVQFLDRSYVPTNFFWNYSDWNLTIFSSHVFHIIISVKEVHSALGGEPSLILSLPFLNFRHFYFTVWNAIHEFAMVANPQCMYDPKLIKFGQLNEG